MLLWMCLDLSAGNGVYKYISMRIGARGVKSLDFKFLWVQARINRKNTAVHKITQPKRGRVQRDLSDENTRGQPSLNHHEDAFHALSPSVVIASVKDFIRDELTSDAGSLRFYQKSCREQEALSVHGSLWPMEISWCVRF